MNTSVIAVISLVIVSCTAQRSPYAGKGPVGYPALSSITTTTAAAPLAPLADRFLSDPPTTRVPTTTPRLPIEALGDVDLYNRLTRLPIDQQPFWLINWQALESHRNNPQTYNSNQNSFIDNNIRG